MVRPRSFSARDTLCSGGQVLSMSQMVKPGPRRAQAQRFLPHQRTSSAWRGTSDKCLNIGYRGGAVDRLFVDPLLWPDSHTVHENELDC